MNATTYLLTAYAATWLIHIGYILYLGSRARRLADDVKELARTSQDPGDETR